jgi:hypothetical protein
MISDADMRSYCDEYQRRGIYKKKSETGWCKVVNVLWNILTFSSADDFMNRPSTTGNHIYMHRGWDYKDTPVTLTYITTRHEAQHLHFFDRFGTVLGLIIYLFLPLPIGLAYGRYRVERNAIVEELLAIHSLGGDAIGRLSEYVLALSGSSYFYAWPFRNSVRYWLMTEFLRRRDARMDLELANSRL